MAARIHKKTLAAAAVTRTIDPKKLGPRQRKTYVRYVRDGVVQGCVSLPSKLAVRFRDIMGLPTIRVDVGWPIRITPADGSRGYEYIKGSEYSGVFIPLSTNFDRVDRAALEQVENQIKARKVELRIRGAAPAYLDERADSPMHVNKQWGHWYVSLPLHPSKVITAMASLGLVPKYEGDDIMQPLTIVIEDGDSI